MSKFDDQLYEDLMREHGAALTTVTPRPEPRTRRVIPRRAVLAGGGCLAAAGVIAGTLVTAGGASPAYAAAKNPDGTLSVAVYKPSGYAPVNARLRQLGERQVVVVPVRAGCPAPARRAVATGHAVRTSGRITGPGKGASVTVRATGIPAGDLLVIGIERTGRGTAATSYLTSPPAPSCVPPPPSGGFSGRGHASG